MSNQRFAKIEGHSDLIRDMDSGSVINVDRTAYSVFRKRKMEHAASQAKLNDISERVDRLESLINTLIDEFRKR